VIVVVAPVDTAPCDSVCAAIVSTRTVGGDEDVTSVVILVPQAVTWVVHLFCGYEWMRWCLDLSVSLDFEAETSYLTGAFKLPK